MNASPSVLLFHPFELDLETGELRRDGTPAELRPQATHILLLLARSPGRLVTREEIREQVWPETVVEFDQGINACIRQIRTALGDDATAPRYIETVPRRGYRFVAPVERIVSAHEGEPAGVAGEGGRRRLPRRPWRVAALLTAAVVGSAWMLVPGLAGPDSPVTVAVIPIQTDIGGSEEEALARSLTAGLMERLEDVEPGALRVIPWTWSMRYDRSRGRVEEEGRVTRVDVALEGSVRREGEHVRIQLGLIRIRDGVQLWTRRYEQRGPGPTSASDEAVQGAARAIAEHLLARDAASRRLEAALRRPTALPQP